MAQASGKQLAVGMKSAVAFALDSDGLPAATSPSTAYEGVEFNGSKSLDMTIPDARRIVHSGNDRVLAIDFLAPIEPSTGVLTIARNDLVLAALLANVKTFAVGESLFMPWQTEQQGNEIDIALLTFQQSLDAVTKLRSWRILLMPKVRVYPKLAGMNENAAVFQYEIAPNPTTKHLWGATMSTGTEGAAEAAMLEGMGEDRPKIIAFKTDGYAVDFNFPTNFPATSAAKVKCWLDGTPSTPTSTLVNKVTYGVAPTADQILVVYYEY